MKNNDTVDRMVESQIKQIADRVGSPIDDFEGKTVLISGACGFLGSWFIAVFDYLNRNKFKDPVVVVAVDSFIAADKQNALKNIASGHIRFVKGDISDNAWMYSSFGPIDKIDYIIHAAGIASPVFYRKYPIETIDGMVLGLSNLLKHSVNFPVTSFLYFSSSEIYGNPYPEHVPTEESYNGNVSPIGPRSCYDESKRMGEAMAVAYHKIHKIPIKSVRPFNVYGPGMRINDDRVVPKFIFQALKGESLTVHQPAVQTRTFCYITDAMVGFLKTLLVGRNGEVYNIGHSTPEISMQELAVRVKELFSKRFDIPVDIKYVEMPTEYPRDQAQRRCPAVDKAKKDLDFLSVVRLEDGLNYMIDWCKEVYEKKG